MKPLGKPALETVLKGPKPNSALLWLEASQDSERAMREIWAERVNAAMKPMIALVNVGESPEELDVFQRLVPRCYDIAHESHWELLTLRNELRTFWDEVSKERSHVGATGVIGDNSAVAVILDKWWKRYDLESEGWYLFWENGTFFPAPINFRGIIARIVFDKRRYLSICPGCNQYFIKRRDDQKYCLTAACQRKANNMRQQKFQGKMRKSTKKTGRRKK